MRESVQVLVLRPSIIGTSSLDTSTPSRNFGCSAVDFVEQNFQSLDDSLGGRSLPWVSLPHVLQNLLIHRGRRWKRRARYRGNHRRDNSSGRGEGASGASGRAGGRAGMAQTILQGPTPTCSKTRGLIRGATPTRCCTRTDTNAWCPNPGQRTSCTNFASLPCESRKLNQSTTSSGVASVCARAPSENERREVSSCSAMVFEIEPRKNQLI